MSIFSLTGDMSSDCSFEVPPVVTLSGVIEHPYDLAVATARTCYSAKGIIKVADVSKTE